MTEDALMRWLERLQDLASYRPGDFLMFSPRAYWRLFELHNEAWWPLPLWLPALAVAAAMWAWRGGPAARVVVPLALAAASLFVAQAFVLRHYEPINWAARGVAWLGWAQALALALIALRGGLPATPDPWRGRAALAIASWALCGHLLLAPLAGRPLAQAEVFGLAPDPTAMAVLAWLLQGSAAAAGRWARAVVVVAWGAALAQCAVSAATLATMGQAQAAAPLLAGLGAAAAALAARRRRPRSAPR